MTQKIKLVGGNSNFGVISSELDAEIQRVIARFKIGPKMESKLLLDLYRQAEMRSAPERKTYIETRFDEEVERYIGVGVATALCLSPDEYRAMLLPLRARVLAFFAPPALHPIVDGELTLLIVHPKEMLSLRPLLMLLRAVRTDSHPLMSTELKKALVAAKETTELTTLGTPIGILVPTEPYVLVGVSGGRILEDCTTTQANQQVSQFDQRYLSLHQYIQLLLLRPHFLAGKKSEAIVLGDKLSCGYVKFFALDGVPHLDIVGKEAAKYCQGVGKPYYSKILTA